MDVSERKSLAFFAGAMVLGYVVRSRPRRLLDNVLRYPQRRHLSAVAARYGPEGAAD